MSTPLFAQAASPPSRWSARCIALAVAGALSLAAGVIVPSAPQVVAATLEAEAGELQVLVISTQHWLGDNDVIVQFLDEESRPVVDPEASVRLSLIAPDGTEREVAPPTLGRWAVTGRDLWVTRVPFDRVGRWTVRAVIDLGGQTLAGWTFLDVVADGGTPPLGSLVPSVDTPTMADVLSLVDAISSDPEPIGAFYVSSVADELANGQPFAFVLDSYAYRPNEACGGALGILHDIFIEYPSLAVIHAEPWRMRFVAGELTLDPVEGPATLTDWATAWGVDQPPWVFVVDGEGRLRAKFEGVFGTDELRAAMTAVSSWHPFGAAGSPPPEPG